MNNLIRNPLGEEIPKVWEANDANSVEGKWAANLRPAPLGRGITNATAIGRATDIDIRTGWVGHLTTREMKDRWDRHGSVIPANHMDNHSNGTSCASYEAVRWGALWIKRHTKGWTPLAFLGDEWITEEYQYHDDDVDNFGAPRWWTLSQLG